MVVVAEGNGGGIMGLVVGVGGGSTTGLTIGVGGEMMGAGWLKVVPPFFPPFLFAPAPTLGLGIVGCAKVQNGPVEASRASRIADP